MGVPESVAIDFGASATKAAWRDRGGVIHLVRFGTTGEFSSVVRVSSGGSVSVHSADGSPRELRGIKQRISESGPPLSEREIAVGATAESVRLIDVTSAILGYAMARTLADCETTSEHVTGRLPVVLTHPVLWGKTETQFLADALNRSFLPTASRFSVDVSFATEPEAAAYFGASRGLVSLSRSPVAIFDIGAATLDIAVIAADGDSHVTLASRGHFSGGEDLDIKLLQLVESLLGQEHGTASLAAFRRSCREQAYSSRAEARRAKEALSADPQFIFTATLMGDGDDDGTNVDVEIDRADFEEAIDPILEGWTQLLDECLASLPSSRSVSAVLCTGGTALIPELQKRIKVIAESYNTEMVVIDSKEITPGQCVAPGALEVRVARETARRREEERIREEERRREAEERERERERDRRSRRIRSHNAALIHDAIKSEPSLRSLGESLKDRVSDDDELIAVIRYKPRWGVASRVFDRWSLMAISATKMTVEPSVGDGWWRYGEVESLNFSDFSNNMNIKFGHDQIWIGFLTGEEARTITAWARGNLD
jgi:actin-like ATPase involved in cell morphogenesis